MQTLKELLDKTKAQRIQARKTPRRCEYVGCFEAATQNFDTECIRIHLCSFHAVRFHTVYLDFLDQDTKD